MLLRAGCILQSKVSAFPTSHSLLAFFDPAMDLHMTVHFARTSKHQSYGILQAVKLPVAWERVVELCIGQRPSDAPSMRLFLEVSAPPQSLYAFLV